MNKSILIKQKLELEQRQKELLTELKNVEDKLDYIIWELNRVNKGRSIKLIIE